MTTPRTSVAKDTASTTATPAPFPYRIALLRPEQLLAPVRRHYLPKLNNLINDAYSVMGHPPRDIHGQAAEQPLYKSMRINTEDQLVQELSPDGLLAICIDDSLTDDTGDSGKLIAVASCKPWAGKRVALFLAEQSRLKASGVDVDTVTTAEGPHVSLRDAQLASATLNEDQGAPDTWDWEISTCATINSSVYRKQGLMTRCIDRLTAELRRQQEETRSRGDAAGSRGVAAKIRLWVSALDGSGTPEYWAKRGFVKEGEADIAPQGMWSSTRDFRIVTMSKLLEA